MDFTFTEEHEIMRQAVRRFVEREIAPHVDEWEEGQSFPAHEVWKKLGDAGFLGITKPPEYGGLGLDWSYAMVMAEELGHVRCAGVPMAIGVHTDMCTPALARFGSDELRQEYLAPSIAGDYVGCLGVSESVAGSDVAAIGKSAQVVAADTAMIPSTHSVMESTSVGSDLARSARQQAR